jgi:hypothetical protein
MLGFEADVDTDVRRCFIVQIFADWKVWEKDETESFDERETEAEIVINPYFVTV